MAPLSGSGAIVHVWVDVAYATFVAVSYRESANVSGSVLFAASLEAVSSFHTAWSSLICPGSPDRA